MEAVSTLGKRKKSIDADPVADIPHDRKTAKSLTHISLTTHAGVHGEESLRVKWGDLDPEVRGPIVATNRHEMYRNAIGAHGGPYCIYRALAVVSSALDTKHFPDLSKTLPVAKIGPHPQWGQPDKIVTIDPFGHIVTEAFPEHFEKGYDIRPTIAVTRAHMDVPELQDYIRRGLTKPDGKILTKSGQVNVTKAAIEPVWHLPGVAKRFNVSEYDLRMTLFRETNGMYPELLTRTDLKVFLPPIGGISIYIIGDVEAITDPNRLLAVRVHDECNGSDVFGSDICTCRPYLAHAIDVCVKTAQEGGCGLIVYFRKEGRALGEVTKYLVYNLRKRQAGGDTAEEYFNCTQMIAGIQDVRFQALMPDALHWLGVTRIDRFVSMSDMKYNAIIDSGIEIVERIPIPQELVPRDAQVEITAKVFAGYNGGDVYHVDKDSLKKTRGRSFDDLGEKGTVAPEKPISAPASRVSSPKKNGTAVNGTGSPRKVAQK